MQNAGKTLASSKGSSTALKPARRQIPGSGRNQGERHTCGHDANGKHGTKQSEIHRSCVFPTLCCEMCAHRSGDAPDDGP